VINPGGPHRLATFLAMCGPTLICKCCRDLRQRPWKWGYCFAERFYLPSQRQYSVSHLAIVTRLRSFVSTQQPYLISQIQDVYERLRPGSALAELPSTRGAACRPRNPRGTLDSFCRCERGHILCHLDSKTVFSTREGVDLSYKRSVHQHTGLERQKR
jgi:hypothetical protein